MSAALPNPAPLTEEQKKLIKATVPVLAQHGADITRVFYAGVIGENPVLRNLFNHSKQRTGDQADALARAVLAYATHIDDLTPLLPAVARITHRHASLGIAAALYEPVGTHLLKAIAAVVGADVFCGDLYDAWASAYWHLARILIAEEEKLYAGGAWAGWRPFEVRKRVQEADDVVSFYLAPKDGTPLPLHVPGQYVSVQMFVPQLGSNQSRQYSLSASPNPEHLRISVRRDRGMPADASLVHPGWLSNLLHDTLEVGSTLEVSAPRGEFVLEAPPPASAPPVVFLGAGVGVTALLPMLHTTLAAHADTPAGWVHVVRSRAAHALHGEVPASPSVRRAVFYTRPEPDAVEGKDYDFAGRMTVDRVPAETLFLADKRTTYYVCGPDGFVRDTKEGLVKRGVDAARVKAEVFGAA